MHSSAVQFSSLCFSMIHGGPTLQAPKTNVLAATLQVQPAISACLLVCADPHTFLYCTLTAVACNLDHRPEQQLACRCPQRAALVKPAKLTVALTLLTRRHDPFVPLFRFNHLQYRSHSLRLQRCTILSEGGTGTSLRSSRSSRRRLLIMEQTSTPTRCVRRDTEGE